MVIVLVVVVIVLLFLSQSMMMIIRPQVKLLLLLILAMMLGNGNDKKSEGWWEKLNYMSLLNLMDTMMSFGPLILWWDGGGKGERYIQQVKPHIKRGVRGDHAMFCVRLLDKLYRLQQLSLLEKRYVHAGKTSKETTDNSDDEEEEVQNVLDDMHEEMGLVNDPDEVPDLTAEQDDTTQQENSADASQEEPRRALFSTLEEGGMTKARTIHIYRNKEAVQKALKGLKPVAGIVEACKNQETGEVTGFEFQIVYRKPVRQFARMKVPFDDDNGLQFYGMWCSQIQVDPNNVEASYPPTKNFKDIQAISGFAAVAIPLRCIFGKDHEHSKKYYVTTNWWKERMRDGEYRLPVLDSSLYSDSAVEEGTTTTNPRDVQGLDPLLQEASSPSSKKKKRRRGAKEEGSTAEI